MKIQVTVTNLAIKGCPVAKAAIRSKAVVLLLLLIYG